MTNPHRDQAYIKTVLAAIERKWQQHPDLSFGQLLVVKIRPGRAIPELFTLSDESLVGLMRADAYDQHGSNRLSSA